MKLSSLAPVGLLAALLPLQSVHAGFYAGDAYSPSLYFNTYVTNNFELGTWPKSMAIADFDHDGYPDAAVGDRDTRDIRLLTNLGYGEFVPMGPAPVGLNGIPYYMRAADFDQDGWNDLVVVDTDIMSVIVLRNQGGYFIYDTSSPTYAVVSSVDIGRNTSLYNAEGTPSDSVLSLARADMNGDGLMDIIVGHKKDDSVHVFFNQSTYGYLDFAAAPPVLLTGGSSPWALQAADINRDGATDIAVIQTNGDTLRTAINGTVQVLFNCNSASRLCVDATRTPLMQFPYEIAARDLNGDFKPELAIVNADSRSVSVVTNSTATGAMTVSFNVKNYTVGTMPKSVVMGDFNGDCTPDVVVSNHIDSVERISVLLNAPTSPGTLSKEIIQYAPVKRGLALHQVDINLDGALDMALLSVDDRGDSETLVTLMNTTSARCR